MKRILCIVPILLLMAGMAAAQDVRFNYDKTADFTKYKTYKWVEIGSSDKDPLVDPQIRGAIEAEITKKGLTKTESDTADLYIGYQVAITTREANKQLQHRLWIWCGLGRALLPWRLWWLDYELVHYHYALYRHAANRLIRPLGQENRVPDHWNQDYRHQGKTGQAREEIGQGRSQDAEGLPAQSQ